jgi:transposase
LPRDAEAVDRGGLRLKLLKAQAEVGDIVLWKACDLEIVTPSRAAISSARRAICRRPRWARSANAAWLALLTWIGPLSRTRTNRLVRHPGFGAVEAIERLQMRDEVHAPLYWLAVEGLPKYAPELNDIEIVLGRSEIASPCAPNLHRSRQPRQRHSPRRRRIEFGPKPQSVGWAENLCLAPAPYRAPPCPERSIKSRATGSEAPSWMETPNNLAGVAQKRCDLLLAILPVPIVRPDGKPGAFVIRVAHTDSGNHHRR